MLAITAQPCLVRGGRATPRRVVCCATQSADSERPYARAVVAGLATLLTSSSAFAGPLQPVPVLLAEQQSATEVHFVTARAPSVFADVALGDVKNKAESALDDAQDAAEDVTSSVKGAKRSAKSKAEDALQDAKSAVKGAAADAKSAAEDATSGELGGLFKSAARNAQDTADDFLDPVREESSKLGSAIKSAGKDAKRDAKAAVNRTTSQADSFIDTSQPQARGTYTGILLFAGAVLALGFLARNPGERVEDNQNNRSGRRK